VPAKNGINRNIEPVSTLAHWWYFIIHLYAYYRNIPCYVGHWWQILLGHLLWDNGVQPDSYRETLTGTLKTEEQRWGGLIVESSGPLANLICNTLMEEVDTSARMSAKGVFAWPTYQTLWLQCQWKHLSIRERKRDISRCKENVCLQYYIRNYINKVYIICI
jgi:hypothetical protein